MALPTPPDQREYMFPYLSDRVGEKVIVVCQRCSIRYQWDAMALLERIDEDCNYPTLIGKLKKALKCELALQWRYMSDPQCQLVYDVNEMERINRLRSFKGR